MHKMELSDHTNRIDQIDQQLVALLQERLEASAELAAFQKEQGLPLRDSWQEREHLDRLAGMAGEDKREYIHLLYSLIFDLNKSHNSKRLGWEAPLPQQIRHAIDHTPPLFPEGQTVVCQGVAGAYSQLACDKAFKNARILFVKDFDNVFTAIEAGLARYGVIPVENSTAGTVNNVYDLMMKHHFSIVKSVRLKVDHNLLVNPGAKQSDIREIFSHPQAISQCASFLKSLPEVKVTPCANTAMAAEMVARSGRKDIAALSSYSCMRLYGLECLQSSVQDQGNNYTRFICITKEPEIYPGADRTSLMATLPHKPGALYKLLARFYAQDINLIKLESRPLPDRDFEFMFYFDLQASVYSPSFMALMGELPDICETFTYLGSYSEVI